jgi:tetratricopeptide (TPR) repeat protein
MVNQMDPLMEKMNTAVYRNSDVKLIKDALPAMLIQIDGLIEVSPDNTDLLIRAAEAYYGYSFVFVEDTDKARAGRLYDKSFQYAARALKQNKKMAAAFDGKMEAFNDALMDLDESDVPALFWTANAWLSWVGMNVDDPEIFLALPKIRAMLKRAVELDETYQYGAAHTALGVLHASRAPAQGGNPRKAKAEFDRAFELSNNKVLLFHLMYAKYYAYQVQDRQLYVETLNHIVGTPDDMFPEMAFINAAAKKKARQMLNDVNQVF